MTASTLVRFLLGDRRAILDVAASRRGWLAGLLLVLSAGLAREYDHEDLLREPWHALLPLGASLLTATILFALLGLVWWRRSATGWPPRGGYRAFLGLYWATAPLAWLYAIPVERLLPVDRAVAANLWLLAIVSVWRVALMSRIVQVVWRCHGWAAFQIVGLFAWGVASVAMFLVPVPIISIMGGVELAPAEALIAGTTVAVAAGLVFSAPLWLAGGIAILLYRRRPGGPWTPDPAFGADACPVGRSAWGVAVAAVAAGLALLPSSQPEQRLRHDAERLLRGGGVREAIRLMAAHARDDFPPHWDPPPRPAYGERAPPLTDVVEAIADVDPPDWVRESFFRKAANMERSWPDGGPLARLDDESLARYVDALGRLPDGARWAGVHATSIAMVLRRPLERDPTLAPGTRRRALLDRVLALGGGEPPPRRRGGGDGRVTR